MIVREYIESYKDQLVGYKLHIEDYNGYRRFTIKLNKETNLDNVIGSLEHKLLDDELVGIHGDPDDGEKQMILTSRCQL